MSEIELTFQAPTLEVLKAVDLTYFNSVYLGQPFCLKIKDNLLTNLDDLGKALDYLHKKNKKAYLSTPVVPVEKDFPSIFSSLRVAHAEGISGVEVHDMGILRLVRREFPEVPVHSGLFANVYHKAAAKKFYELGVTRISPSQELSFKELSQFLELPNLEIEISVQGKLPLGVANACLLSMELPSRKELPCKQTCAKDYWLTFEGWRMKTMGTATFSGSDLCLLTQLPLLFKEGFRIFRLNTLFDWTEAIIKLGRIYSEALAQIESGDSDLNEKLVQIRKVVGNELCNGWFFGVSGREYVETKSVEERT